jgi:hypothetical protein
MKAKREQQAIHSISPEYPRPLNPGQRQLSWRPTGQREGSTADYAPGAKEITG